MATTVQISEATKRLLDSLQTSPRQPYDAIIRELILAYKNVPRSTGGALPAIAFMAQRRYRNT